MRVFLLIPLLTTGCISATFDYVEDVVLEMPLKDIGVACEEQSSIKLNGRLAVDVYILGDTCFIEAGATPTIVQYEDVEDTVGKKVAQEITWNAGGMCRGPATEEDEGEAWAQCTFAPWASVSRKIAGEEDYEVVTAEVLPDGMTAEVQVGYLTDIDDLTEPADGLPDVEALLWTTTGETFPSGEMGFDDPAFFNPFDDAASAGDDLNSQLYGVVKIPMADVPAFGADDYVVKFGYQLFVQGGTERLDLLALF